MKRFMASVVLLAALSACALGNQKYEAEYAGKFDVTVQLTAFAGSKAEFDRAAKAAFDVIERDGKLYDIYNSYEDVNNIKTINDSAGVAPVPVDPEIIDLLEFSFKAHEMTGGAVNVAMGPVLRVWHTYREQGTARPDAARLPPMSVLREKSGNTDIADVVIDRQAGTVFLKKPGMSLDLGAIAKGYTAQRAVEAAKEAGLQSVLLNMGGNVVSCGKPMDGRDRWAVGIQDPGLKDGSRGVLDTVYVNDAALVSSGDYQRFYTVNGVRYNHIIDPDTLMPAGRFAHVTVLHPDSGVADVLSTAIFLLPLEEGRALLKKNGAQGMWVYHDGTVEATPGFAAISQKLGGYSATD